MFMVAGDKKGVGWGKGSRYHEEIILCCRVGCA
jgi:hypothetical protein